MKQLPTTLVVKALYWISSVLIAGLFFAFIIIPFREVPDKDIVEKFHKIYYRDKPHLTTYLGVMSMQYPVDNWAMQELIYEIKPDFIIETGTAHGGTALFYASILEKVNENGKVITIDIKEHSPEVLKFDTWKNHVEFIKGSSTSPNIASAISKKVKGQKVIVTLDSNHMKSHVLEELRLYSKLVPLNSYIVVQDTHLNGHPIYHFSTKGEGPWEAVEEFLKTNKNFKIDQNRKKHLISAYPSGFLKRIK
jgi:cephalosporin hydroxylase